MTSYYHHNQPSQPNFRPDYQTGQKDKFAIYTRVSTPGQVDNGSIEEQVARAENLCRERGWTVADHYCDPGISGALFEERGELQRLIAEGRAGKFKFVLIWDVDRLARTELVFAQIVHALEFELGIQVVNTANPQVVEPAKFNPRDRSRRFMQGVQALMAQDAYYQLMEKSVAGKKRRIREGKFIFPKVAYGYKRVWDEETRQHIVIPQPDELKYVRMFPDFVRENLSDAGIAARLDLLGATPRRGKFWSASTVYWIRTNPFYAGKVSYGRLTTMRGKVKRQFDQSEIILADHACPSQCEHPWTWEEFQEIQIRRTSRAGRKPRPRHDSPHPLGGLLKCTYCGYGMVYTITSYRKIPYYICAAHMSNPNACTKNRAPANALLAKLWEHIDELAQKAATNPDEYYDRLKNSSGAGRVEQIGLQLAELEKAAVTWKKAARSLTKCYLSVQ